jgi:hypothetical protein
LNHAGQPSRIGGAVTRVFGWVVLGVGLSIALLFALLGLFIFSPMTALVLGLPIAAVSASFALLLLKSGAGLQRLGTGEQRSARIKAIFALAQNRGGMTNAWDVAQSLDMRLDEADALLTELAKTTPDQVSLELDDAGGIYYRFPALLSPLPEHIRVDVPNTQPNAGAAESDVVEADVVPPLRERR